jgi:chromosome segregation ATPase
VATAIKVKAVLQSKDVVRNKRFYELRIQSLEQTIQASEARIQNLSKQLEAALKQVQDLAVKAIEGASNIQFLSSLQRNCAGASESANKG